MLVKIQISNGSTPPMQHNGGNGTAAAEAVMLKIRAEHGLQTRIAEGLGISPQAVGQWSVIPLDRIVEVERVTGIPRHELRPDFHLPPKPRKRRTHQRSIEVGRASDAAIVAE
jgi:DNA-binding transcriptional regulator YdaS (Cro superfamily)